MLTLITGGSASGKSEYAEQLAVADANALCIYIATMQPFDLECEARIAKHRHARAHRGFVTIERYTDLAGIVIPPGASVLLECMSNLAANELYSDRGAGGCTARAVIKGIKMLCERAKQVVIVSNEVFSDGVQYDADTAHYLSVLGEINCAIAGLADRVIEVVYTIPIIHKAVGEESI